MSQGQPIVYIIIGVILTISYLIYRGSKGNFFKGLHTPRPVKPVIESEHNEKHGIAFLVSALLAFIVTNNFLSEIRYFKELFAEDESWVFNTIGIVFIITYVLFELAFYIAKQIKHR